MRGNAASPGASANESSGVTIDAFAGPESLDEFVSALRSEAPPAAVIDALDCFDIPFEPAATFHIVDS